MALRVTSSTKAKDLFTKEGIKRLSERVPGQVAGQVQAGQRTGVQLPGKLQQDLDRGIPVPRDLDPNLIPPVPETRIPYDPAATAALEDTGIQTLDDLATATGSQYATHQPPHVNVWNAETGQYDSVPVDPAQYEDIRQEQLTRELNINAPQNFDFTTPDQFKEQTQSIYADPYPEGRGLNTDRIPSKYVGDIYSNQQTEGIPALADSNLTYEQLFGVQGEANAIIEESNQRAANNPDEDVLPHGDEQFNHALANVISVAANAGISSLVTYGSNLDEDSNTNPDETQKEAVYDVNGNELSDADHHNKVISTVAYNMRTAARKVGFTLTNKTSQRLAAEKVAKDTRLGIYDQIQAADGNLVLRPSPAAKANAKKTARLQAALTGKLGRHLASQLPIPGSGRGFTGQPETGVHTTERGFPATRRAAASDTLDMFGRIQEIGDDATTPFSQLRYASIANPEFLVESELTDDQVFEGATPEELAAAQVYYSSHEYADQLRLGKKHFNKLMNEYSWQSDPTDPSKPVSRDEQNILAREHAITQMRTRFREADIDLNRYADHNLKGPQSTPRTNSTANQRMDRAAPNSDSQASKEIRDTLNVDEKSKVRADTFFDKDKQESITRKGQAILKLVNQPDALLRAYNNLTVPEASAIGWRIMAATEVMRLRNTLHGENIDIGALSPLFLFNEFIDGPGGTMDYLSVLGSDFFRLLDHSDQAGRLLTPTELAETDPELAGSPIFELVSKLPRGELMGSVNLWTDAYKLVDADANENTDFIDLTSLAYLDGRQNGIFLQGVYSGNTDFMTRLGHFSDADGSFGDVRDKMWAIKNAAIDAVFKSDINQAYYNSATEIFAELNELDNAVNDFNKAPLMQFQYSKDASMFEQEVFDFFQEPEYREILEKHIGPGNTWPDDRAAARDLKEVLKFMLLQSADPAYTKLTARMGRGFSFLNVAPVLPGSAGDSWAFGSKRATTMLDPEAGPYSVHETEANGRKFRVSEPNVIGFSATGFDPEGLLEPITLDAAYTRITPVAFAPVKAKRFIDYSDADDKGPRAFNSSPDIFGLQLQRQMAVLPIQSADGDALKLMMQFVNQGRKVPLPVSTTHDALSAPAHSFWLYQAAYNNVAMPQIMEHAKTWLQEMVKSFDAGKERAFDIVDEQGEAGIGRKSVGKNAFPAVADFFQEWHEKINNDSYIKDVLGGPNEAHKFIAEVNNMLSEAKKAGWAPRAAPGVKETPDDIHPQIADNLLVSPEQFKRLYQLFEGFMGFEKGGRIRREADAQSNKIRAAHAKLLAQPGHRERGIGQMTMSSSYK